MGSNGKWRIGMIGLLAGSVALSGCGKKEEPPPPPPPPPQGPPPPPPPVSLTSVKPAGIDARVSFEQKHAPVDPALARGIFALSDAIARKDDQTLNSIFDRRGKEVLPLVRQGWSDLQMEAVRVVYVDDTSKSSADATTATLVLAVKSINQANPAAASGATVLTWSGERVGDSWVFSPRSSTNELRPLATDWDDRPYSEYVGSDFGLSPELEAMLSMPFIPSIDGDDADRRQPPSQPAGGGGGGGNQQGG